MRDSVRAAWPSVCKQFEGRCTYMYCDSKGLVTTGTGNLIDSISAAQNLPWLTPMNTPASSAQVEAEWRKTKANPVWKHASGYAYEKTSTLHLDEAILDSLLLSVTDRFWSTLKATLPNLETCPADAQLALMDLAWQNGPGFLNTWNDTRRSVLAQDFDKTASVLNGSLKAGPRTTFRVRLFRNAAAVLRLDLDQDVLWNTRTPSQSAEPLPAPVPTPEPVPAPIPTSEPPEGRVVQHDKTYGDYVVFRGGKVPPLLAEVLAAIPTNVVMVQGGLQNSRVKASAKTHNGLGAYDLSVKGMSKKKTNAYAAELIRSGEEAFPRGGLWGTGFFTSHLHVVSHNCRDQLHPEAKAQDVDFRHDPRLNGLVGHARYQGPSTPLGSWDESPYNPKNIREVGGVFYVASDTLLGLDVDRVQKESKVKGDRIAYVRQVKRWGRWNAVTKKGRYFAIENDGQTMLTTAKPVVS